MEKLYYIKWHPVYHLTTYWVCFAKSEQERDLKFKKYCEENNLQLGAYSPRAVEMPENGLILTRE